MKIFFFITITLILFSSSLVAKEKRILFTWEENFVAQKGYKGEVIQVLDDQQMVVHSFKSTGTKYIWNSDKDGFFILKVTPLDGTGAPINEELQEKKLFISNSEGSIAPKKLFLCDESYPITWKRSVGKAKYLIRVKDIGTDQIIMNKVTRLPRESLLQEQLLPNHQYHVTVIEYQVGGDIRLALNDYYHFRSCSERPLRELPPLTNTASSIYFLPRYSTLEQSGLKSVSSSQVSYLSFGMDATGPRFGKNAFWGRVDYRNYEKDGDSLSFEELAVEFNYLRYLENNWTLLAGLEYEDFGSYNLEAMDEVGELLEDRHRLIYIVVGAKKLFWPFGKRFELKGTIGYSVFSSTTFGDENSDNQVTYTGVKGKVISDLYLSTSFFIKGGFEGRLLSGNGDFARYDIFIGPGYNF